MKNYDILNLLKHDILRSRELIYGSSKKISYYSIIVGFFSFKVTPVIMYRFSRYFHLLKLPFLSKFFSFINFIFFGLEISPRCNIGKGLFLPHTQGTVIGAWSIGENATIFQGVTLGAKELDFYYSKDKRPVIGDNVIIGAGAKIIGYVHIGSNARIGANAVVTKNIPSSKIATGVPAEWH